MERLDEIVKHVEELNILELTQLVKKLEEKFGVSSAMPMMAAPAAKEEAEEAAEKTSFNVHLLDGGGQKIQVIKVVRELTGKGLKEAKDLVDKVPQVVKENVAKAEAEEIKKKLEAAGGKVEIK